MSRILVRLGGWWLTIIGAVTGVLARAALADSTSSTTATSLDPGGDVRVGIPLPNSGRAPHASGDRGGWAQLTLLAIMVLGLAFIAWRIVRTQRRNVGTD